MHNKASATSILGDNCSDSIESDVADIRVGSNVAIVGIVRAGGPRGPIERPLGPRRGSPRQSHNGTFLGRHMKRD